MSAEPPTVPNPIAPAPPAQPGPAGRGGEPGPPAPAGPPARWTARASVPSAAAAGQARAGRLGDAEPASFPTYLWQLQWVPRRSRLRGILGAVVALALLVAVPVVSAYVSYKLASGENPFEWPPTVDWDRVFS